jgi:N-acetylneuraminic acid mutarotase
MQRPILLSQAVVVDGRVIVAGGTLDAALSSFTDQVWAGDGTRWAIVGRLPHGPVAMSAAAIAGDHQMFLFGGCSAGPLNHNDAVRFDIQTGSWQAIRPVPITARGTAGVALDKRYILLAGGYSESAFSRRCFLYDTQSDEYHSAPDLPIGLSGPAIVRSGDAIYVCGGEPQMRARSPLVLRAEIMR